MFGYNTEGRFDLLFMKNEHAYDLLGVEKEGTEVNIDDVALLITYLLNVKMVIYIYCK